MNNIAYWKSVGAAWTRMKVILFQPFSIEKWFIMGFAAWIAGLSAGGGGSSGGGGNYHAGSPGECWNGSQFSHFWHTYGAVIITVGLVLFLVIAALSIAMAWVHARGRFIFLDNLVYNRAAIVEPWKKYRRQGNSLFLWNLAVGFIGLLFFVFIAVIMLVSILPMLTEQAPAAVGIPGIILAVLLIFVYSLLIGYLQLLVHDFVVPIMLKHDLRIREAWGRFNVLLKPAIGHFIVYGLVIFLVNMLVSFALFGLVIASCCMLLLVLIIPYIGTVVLLPAHVFRRWISIEFLRQFGENIDDIVPAEEPAAVTPDLPAPADPAG